MKFFDVRFPKDVKTITLFLVLAVILAYGAYNTAGTALHTTIPIVSVVSDSMKHDEKTGSSYYEYLITKFSYTRTFIDTWPLKNGFVRGDLLTVTGANTSTLDVGDVIVYNLKNSESIDCDRFEKALKEQGIDKVVHRIIRKFTENGEIYFMTKGDHNFQMDPCRIQNKEIEGKAIFKLPLVGYLKLIPAKIFGAI